MGCVYSREIWTKVLSAARLEMQPPLSAPILGKVLILTRWYCSSHGLSGMSATVAVFRNESMQPHHLLLLILDEADAWIQAGYRSLAPLLVRAVT